MSLQDPAKKMSKSDENPNGSIYLMDDPDTIIRKFKRAVTDSEACVRYCDEQPGIKNLIDIYRACTGKTPQEIEKEFDGKGYGDFKMLSARRLWTCSVLSRRDMQSFPRTRPTLTA